MWNQIVHELIIQKQKFPYADNTQNETACTYSENTQNEKILIFPVNSKQKLKIL
jgi:hypothetical protein